MLPQPEIDRIESICNLFGIKNYSINPDGSIDVDGNVFISMFKLNIIPLNFNKVTGSFSCASNYLSSLKGCPNEVGGDFHVSNNKLTSLEYFPIEVGGTVNYTDNPWLPGRLQNMICLLGKEDLLVFFKYYNHYDLFENDIINEDNYQALIDDIKEGLK